MSSSRSIVEDFGKPEAPVRLLLCSDVASEGINLHYLSHRLIHFDMPWSLMVFQQRNGRIDRYGQEQTPQIHYLITESAATRRSAGDTRILEVLHREGRAGLQEHRRPVGLHGRLRRRARRKRSPRRPLPRAIKSDDFDAQLDAEG